MRSGLATFCRPLFRALLPVLLLLPAACQRRSAETWDLTDIRGHLPDLRFDLATAGNPHLTARDLRGKVVLVFFGYTHCPDVCPLTMARLAGALRDLGPEAGGVRILFISVDPPRDTPALVAKYARAFSPQAVGATGTPAEIEALARRYRVAYQAEAPDADGNYVVMHSKVVFVFDQQGRARLLIDDANAAPAVVHDLRQLLRTST
jgi:protein SCO1